MIEVEKFKVIEDTENISSIQIEQFRRTIKITRWKKTKQVEFEITEHGEKRNKFSGFGLNDEQIDEMIEFLRWD